VCCRRHSIQESITAILFLFARTRGDGCSLTLRAVLLAQTSPEKRR